MIFASPAATPVTVSVCGVCQLVPVVVIVKVDGETVAIEVAELATDTTTLAAGGVDPARMLTVNSAVPVLSILSPLPLSDDSKLEFESVMRNGKPPAGSRDAKDVGELPT